jgi:hypothetical protein
MHFQSFTHALRALGGVAKGRFVNFAGAQASSVDPVLGVAACDAGPGDMLPVHILGVAAVESGGAVAAGDPIGSDEQGRAVTVAADHVWRVGRSLNAIDAAGRTLFVLIR